MLGRRALPLRSLWSLVRPVFLLRRWLEDTPATAQSIDTRDRSKAGAKPESMIQLLCGSEERTEIVIWQLADVRVRRQRSPRQRIKGSRETRQILLFLFGQLLAYPWPPKTEKQIEHTEDVCRPTKLFHLIPILQLRLVENQAEWRPANREAIPELPVADGIRRHGFRRTLKVRNAGHRARSQERGLPPAFPVVTG